MTIPNCIHQGRGPSKSLEIHVRTLQSKKLCILQVTMLAGDFEFAIEWKLGIHEFAWGESSRVENLVRRRRSV